VPPTRVMGNVVMFRCVKRSGVRYDVDVQWQDQIRVIPSLPVTRLAG
jgi:hypothetical protein